MPFLENRVDYYRDAHLSNAIEQLKQEDSVPSQDIDNMVTWGRLRRSCEDNFTNGNTDAEPKSFSVPNLGFNTGFYAHLIGAGEQMVKSCKRNDNKSLF